MSGGKFNEFGSERDANRLRMNGSGECGSNTNGSAPEEGPVVALPAKADPFTQGDPSGNAAELRLSCDVTVRARPETPSSAETILLVDDDESLLEVIQDILATAGYRVLTASDGRKAVGIYGARKGDIDLVMLDMIMPEMGGAETFRELKKIDPDVPVVIISGYSIPEEVHELLAQGCRGYLRKPFQMSELFRTVRQAMRRNDNKRE